MSCIHSCLRFQSYQDKSVLNSLLSVASGTLSHFLLKGTHPVKLWASQRSLYSWSAGNSIPLERWDPTPDWQVQPWLQLGIIKYISFIDFFYNLTKYPCCRQVRIHKQKNKKKKRKKEMKHNKSCGCHIDVQCELGLTASVNYIPQWNSLIDSDRVFFPRTWILTDLCYSQYNTVPQAPGS